MCFSPHIIISTVLNDTRRVFSNIDSGQVSLVPLVSLMRLEFNSCAFLTDKKESILKVCTSHNSSFIWIIAH